MAINSSDAVVSAIDRMAVSVGTSARLAQSKVTADGNDLFTRVWVQPSLESRERLEAQVLTFHTKAWSSFAPPTCNRRTKPIVGSSHFAGMELSFRAGIRRQ